MKANQIIEGEDYALAGNPHHGAPDHYLQARILSAPAGGMVLVHITHPDSHVDDWDESVKTRRIAGRWDDQPHELSEHHTEFVDPEKRWGPEAQKKTFSAHAAYRYERVLIQRERVDRLAAVGVRRDKSHFGGVGGTGSGGWHTDTTHFDDGEIDHILGAIEALKGGTLAYLTTNAIPLDDSSRPVDLVYELFPPEPEFLGRAKQVVEDWPDSKVYRVVSE